MQHLEQPEHEPGVFCRATEVRGILIFEHLPGKREIDCPVYLSEQVVLGADVVVEIVSVKGA